MPTDSRYRISKEINVAKDKADLLQGTLDMLILKSLSLGELHGYGIIQRIRQLSDEMLNVEQGSLYPALYRIEQKGWVSARWDVHETGREAKFYKLTRAGRKQLETQEASWDRLVLAIAKVGRHIRVATKGTKSTKKFSKGSIEMKWFNILRDRLRALRQRETVINEIDREMRSHLEMQVEANIKAGMSPAEAREQAMRSFGNVNRAVDAAYDVKGGGLFETLSQDIRYGVRMLAKHKAFTSIAVITLALGIGANTAIFSVVNELLLRPLPYRDAERDRDVVGSDSRRPAPEHHFARKLSPLARTKHSYQHIAAFTDQRFNLTGDGEPEELSVQFATPEFFKVLGVDPILGRTFLPEDAEAGKPPVAVLSYGLWQRRFGGQPGVVGQPITLNGDKFP